MPPQPEAAVYRKFRSRSSEDRPCVAVAAVRDGDALRVVVGAVAETPQHFPDVCALGAGRAAEIGRRVRRADRADRRRARLGRVPAPGDRGRGAARGGGGRVIGVDPRVSGAQRYSVHVERPGMLHAAFVRSPHAHARVLAVDAVGPARRLRGAAARGRRRPRALRLPGARPARAGRRRAPRRRHRRRGRGADRGGRARRRAPRRRRPTRSCPPSSTPSRRSRPAPRCCTPTRPSRPARRSRSASARCPARTSATASGSATATPRPGSPTPT